MEESVSRMQDLIWSVDNQEVAMQDCEHWKS